ncbi:hypothetical protein BH18ACT11_BH18ACT11_07360 [soil metagenome]
MTLREIESQFNETFSYWDIYLPPDAFAKRKRGKIVKAGWAIWYLFGSDERGEYLDYYASHRLTTDRHVRIYVNGNEENLPTIQSMRMVSQDPEEDARLEAEYYARNQKVSRMLEDKGFGMAGDEPTLTQVNRYLHTEKTEE